MQYFTANVLSSQDYYAFGMLMPDRQYTLNGDSTYRYGFNGKENDNEVKGLGNQQDYGERFYDDRVNRFLSVDPIARKYPELSSYQFASDSPIWAIDLDGLETAYDNYLDQKLTSVKGSEEAHENAVATGQLLGKITSDFVLGVLTAAFSPFNLLSYHEYGGHVSHNSARYKEIQIEGKQAAKEFAVNVAFYYIGGELFGSAEDIRSNGVSVSEPEANYRTETPRTPENTTQISRPKELVLAENEVIGQLSEDIVGAKLQSQLLEGEAILRKPRIYLRNAEGKLTNQYSVPDFVVYNKNTGKIIDIVDAKNGGAGFTDNQQALFENGGEFKRSSRARGIKPQEIEAGRLRKIQTNLTPGEIKPQ